MASVIGELPPLVAEKDGRLVTPFCPDVTPVPLAVVSAQLKSNEPPLTLLVVVSDIAACVAPLHEVLAVAVGALTSGVGFTVATRVKVAPVQPVGATGVTIYVAVAVVVVDELLSVPVIGLTAVACPAPPDTPTA